MTQPYQGTPEETPQQNWPPVGDDATYVMDSQGVVWYLCPEYDNGMATTAISTGPWSVGINTLIKERGPLYILRASGKYDFRDYCPTLQNKGDFVAGQEIVAGQPLPPQGCTCSPYSEQPEYAPDCPIHGAQAQGHTKSCWKWMAAAPGQRACVCEVGQSVVPDDY